MALTHVIGNVLVDDDELREVARNQADRVADFGAQVATGVKGKRGVRAESELSFSAGVVKASDVTPFTPVDIGTPATIMIRHVYTGRFGNRDMLLTSAVRDPLATSKFKPRAINLMRRHVPRKSHLLGPAATEDGTELVYYSPALTAQSVVVTFDLAFDDFPDELVNHVGGAITTAGSIPLFGPYGAVLLGVGTAIKLVSKLVNALVDARPEFSVTHPLEFKIPGSEVPNPGYKIAKSSALADEDFDFDLQKGLIDKKTKQPYDGDEPYVVFLLDGSRNDNLKEFVPTAASAALLSRFLEQREGSEVAIDSITDALKLSSDLRYRKDADRLQRELEALPGDSSERALLEAKRKAAIANILEDLLKPPAAP